MAEDNRFNTALDALIYFTNELSNKTKGTVFDIAETQKKFQEVLREMPVSEVREIKNVLGSLSGELKSVIDDVVSENDKRIREERNREEEEKRQHEEKIRRQEEEEEKEEQRRREKQKAHEEEIASYNRHINALKEQLNTTTEIDNNFKLALEKQIQDLEKQKQQSEFQYNLETASTEERAVLLNKKYSDEISELRKQKEQENIKQQLKVEKETAESLAKIPINRFDDFLKALTSRISSAVSSIVSSYEKNASNLAAALNTSVDDIGKLQRKIADELNNTTLSTAISNTAVLTEAAGLVSAGYTNVEKLQSTATSIAIGREIAPNINFDTNTVRNLTNVFGSDFITKFSAIQTAVQDTAGSTINISNNLTQMMSDLEPVYLNAQYSNTALQDTSDIQATLSAAQEAGMINEQQAKEYLSMITELMDPSKAFKSRSTTVRAAATTYDFGSGSPLQALQAILGAREAMYGGIDMSSSYVGNVSRSLAAAAYGENTLGATYLQGGLYGLNILQTGDLSSVYNTQLSRLQSGELTTTKERENNAIQNSSIIQGLSNIAEKLPLNFEAFSSLLFAQIHRLPKRIATELSTAIINKTVSTGTGGVGDIIDDSTTTVTPSSSGSTTTTTTSLWNKIIGSDFTSKGVIGTKGSSLGRLTSGFTGLSVGAGILGLANVLGQEGEGIQKWGFGGNTGESMLSYAGMGAGLGSIIGSFLGPGGNLIGAGAGALVGALAGLLVASNAQSEAIKENTEKLQAQTQATKDLLGEGVTAIDTLEAKREIARGGGVVHLSSGDYKIASYNNMGYASGLDYVPYDGFIATLHQGESVVSASSAEKLRKQNPNFWNDSYDGNADVISALEKQTDSIVSAVSGDRQYSPLTRVGPKQYKIQNSFA